MPYSSMAPLCPSMRQSAPPPENGAGAARVQRTSKGIKHTQALETSGGQAREWIDIIGEDSISVVIMQELEGRGDRDGAGCAYVGLHAARTTKVMPAGEIVENCVDGVVNEEMAIGGCQFVRDPLPVEVLPGSLTSQRGVRHDAGTFRVVDAAVE